MFTFEQVESFRIIFTLLSVASMLLFACCVYKKIKLGFHGGQIPLLFMLIIGLFIGPISIIIATSTTILPNSNGLVVGSAVSLAYVVWTMIIMAMWNLIEKLCK